MALSRKHYEALAEILRQANEDTEAWMEPRLVLRKLTDRLAAYLYADSPRFDPKRFYDATLPRAAQAAQVSGPVEVNRGSE